MPGRGQAGAQVGGRVWLRVCACRRGHEGVRVRVCAGGRVGARGVQGNGIEVFKVFNAVIGHAVVLSLCSGVAVW